MWPCGRRHTRTHKMKMLAFIAFFAILHVVLSGRSDSYGSDSVEASNTTSMCYNGGHAVSFFIGTPVYYIGYVLYCIVYPVIVVVQWLVSVASWLAWVLSLPFRLVGYLLWVVLYALWWVLSLVPWLIMKILLFILLTVGKFVANILLTISLIALVLVVYKRTGTVAASILALLIAVAGGMVMSYSLDLLVAVVLCPVQFVWGILWGIKDATVYFQAITTLSYANV